MRLIDDMQQGGCSGIDKYLTFTNFTHDLNFMEADYLRYYSPEIGNPIGNKTILYPPSAAGLTKGIDCEDFALWTSCLKNYYTDVSCSMYYEIGETENHVGFKCVEKIGDKLYYSQT